MAGMASRLFGRGGGGQKGEIPRSPFGQRRCVLALPTEALGSGGGGLGMAVDGELVVQQITDAAGPAAAAEVPVGWRIVGVDDRPVSSAVQLTAAIELATQPQPSGVGDDGARRVALVLHPATEHEKMAAVASKWAAIHRGRHVRNPPPILPGSDSDDDDALYSTPPADAAGRTRSDVSSGGLSKASTPPGRGRHGRWYTAPDFTPGQEAALNRIQAAARGHIVRQTSKELSLRDAPPLTEAEAFWAREVSLTFAEQGPLGLVFTSSTEPNAPVVLGSIVEGRLASRSARLLEAMAKARELEAAGEPAELGKQVLCLHRMNGAVLARTGLSFEEVLDKIQGAHLRRLSSIRLRRC